MEFDRFIDKREGELISMDTEIKKDSDVPEDCHDFIKHFIKVAKTHRKIMERKFSQTGVYRSQHQILMYVADHPNASQKELAALHNVSPATIAVTLKKMEKGGYLMRQVDETDNRFHQIALTEKGWETVEISRKMFKEMEQIMMDGITIEEMHQTEEVLKHIFYNMIRSLPETEKEEMHW